MITMASASSTSVQSPPHNQVFINFRGEQLRNTFVSHLVKAMNMDGINVYIDENETRGKPLTTLFNRIEESKVAIAIFSSLYTQSKWCLNELAMINECAESGKLVVIPIFHKVDTNDVKNLEGDFGDKFWELAKVSVNEKQDKWREALATVPRNFGFTLNQTSNESESITEIVGKVREVLTNLERTIPIDNPGAGDGEMAEANMAPISLESEEIVEADTTAISLQTKGMTDLVPFGIESHIKRLKEMFISACGSTLRIGVVGMPGIGKTTLTEKLYELFERKFVRKAFLSDVHDFYTKGKLERSLLTRELLWREDEIKETAYMSPEDMKALLLKKKCLIVLDNVSDKKQIDVLLGERDWITKGSLIVITTSDKSVIQGKVDETYEVLRLSGIDSSLCFSYYAASGNLKGNFMNLSKEFVDYAKGNPFVLKILGGELNGKNETHWGKKLGMLAKSPNEKIQRVLQISYDELHQLQKDVFLDVACFFRSGDEYYVRCLVESCKNESIDAMSEIKDLASKFLINISGGRVEMHDLLYTFGKQLGQQGSCRVLNHIDFDGALKKTAGGDCVRGIFIDMSEMKDELLLDRCTFTKMRNLRYLKFYNSRCHPECEADYKLNIPDGLDFSMLDEIRYLYWLKFPKKNLPKDFNPENLTDLNLPYSEIEELWLGVKETPKLKWVDLSFSSKLRNLSGLLNAESLQRLNIEGCTSLRKLPEGMERMKSLIFLNMRGCTSLRVLPHINLISLETLILTNCSSLREFRVISDNLETLHLDETAISQLPTNMEKLQRVIVLNLKDCKSLRAVPECLGKLKSLQELVLSGCSKLKTFPIPIENLKRLQILLLDGTAITDTSKILQFNISKVEDLSSLRRLCLSGNVMISNLQIEISRLHQLKCLDLKYCKNLTSIPLLPPNLEILDAHGCEKLKKVASPMAVLKLMEQVQSKFIFTNCNSLEDAAKNSITSYAQRKSQLDAVRCYKEGDVSEPFLVTSFPGSEVPSWFKHREIGSKLKLKFPPHQCDKRLSTIALCAVVAFPRDEVNRFSIECIYEFRNKTETCISFSCVLGGGWIEPRKVESEHVFIGYTSSSYITKHLERLLHSDDNHECGPPKASVEFKVRDGAGEILNCGLSLVYEEPNHVVIEGNNKKPNHANIEGNDEEPNHVVIEGNDEEPDHVNIEGNNREPNDVNTKGNNEEPNHVDTEGNAEESNHVDTEGNNGEPNDVNIEGNNEEPNRVHIGGNGKETSSRTVIMSVRESIVSFATAFVSIVLRFPWVGLVFFLAYGFGRFFR